VAQRILVRLLLARAQADTGTAHPANLATLKQGNKWDILASGRRPLLSCMASSTSEDGGKTDAFFAGKKKMSFFPPESPSSEVVVFQFSCHNAQPLS
jgi:hypothetical protein